MNWDDVRIFLAIVRAGTLSGAAEALQMGIATASRRLDRLEATLGISLFSRHQSGYRLTDDGATLLARAEALEQAGQAFSTAAQMQGKAAGLVRLATTENLANPLIVPSLTDLFRQHPDLRVEVLSGSQSVNLHRRDADMAVRMVKPEVGNLRIRRLGTVGFGLYGSADYIRTRSDSANFEQDSFIGWAETHHHLAVAKSLARLTRGRSCRIETNQLSSQLAAVSAGMGLAVLPHFLARQAGLRCLLTEAGIEPIWLVMHNDLADSVRVRTVADHLVRLFEEKREFLAAP